MVYWEGRPYYGFGMGAASYLATRRFSRPKRLGGYRSWVEVRLLCSPPSPLQRFDSCHRACHGASPLLACCARGCLLAAGLRP